MDFRILGPLEVLSDGRAVALGGTRRRAVLAALLLHANEVVSSDALIDEVWGEDPPDSVVNALQVHVSGLRKALAGGGDSVLVTRPPGYVLRVGAGELDLDRFEQLRAEARAALDEGAPARAAAKLREALGLWRGPPLDDLRFAPSLQIARARLEELRVVALEDRLAADLAAGDHGGLVAELEELVAANPLREGLRAQLMLALYRSDRQAEALEVYRDARRALVEELGIEPGRALQELQQAILAHDASLDAPASAEARGEVRGSPGFVGRARELSQLTERLAAARAGRGSVALLVGEAGIGKTRLADELAARAREQGASVHWGLGWEAGGAPAYWPWVQSLRSLTRSPGGSAAARMTAGAGELAQLLPELVDPGAEATPGHSRPAVAPSDDRFRLFEAVTEFLRAAAAAEPLVLILDDLHVADEPSLLLLHFVAREAATMRILVLGTLREEELAADHPVRTALAGLRRDPGTVTLALEGLDAADVDRYIELVAQAPPPESLVTALHEQTEGNPLFVAEIVQLLAAKDLLGETALSLRRPNIPPTVRDVIGRRISALSGDCVAVLETASVLGREFTLAALERVTRRPSEDLLAVLDEALEQRVLTEGSESSGRLRFSHVLVRDTLYDQLPTARRLRLHRDVGEALEVLYPDDGETLAELALHFLAAAPLGEAVKAVDYARRAGDRAAAMLAFEEAARQYQAALDTLEISGGEPVLRCLLLLGLGDSNDRAGDRDAAREAYGRCAEVAGRAGLPEDLGRAALGYGGRFVWGRATTEPDLVPLLESALEAVGPQDSGLRALLLARLAGATRLGSGDGAADDARPGIADEAVAVARRVGDTGVLAYALEGQMHSLVGPGTAAQMVVLCTEILELAVQAGDRERVFAAYESRLLFAWQLGDLATAMTDLDELSLLGERMRQPAQLWMLNAIRARAALCEGRLAEAEELVERAFAYGQTAQSWNAIVTHELQTYLLRRGQGRGAERAAALHAAIAERPHYQLLRCALTNLKALAGDQAAASRALDSFAASGFGVLPRDDTWLVGMTLLAEACHALGAAQHAATIYELLSPFGNLVASVPPDASMGSVARPLGLLAETLGDLRTAEAHFEHAVGFDERTGAWFWLEESRRDLARLRDRGR